jgi:hypothetical protein
MLKRNYQVTSLIFLSISYTLFTYRSIFNDKLLGEPFDSRLHIILHEHWWKWFNGLVSFRDTGFFYPFDKALNYSDVFLTQGIFYSFLRLIGFDLALSWTITTISLLLIGNLGWVFISKKYIQNFSIQIILVLTFVSSLSFVYYFTLNPNIMGYSYLSWIILFALNISEEKRSDIKNRKISILISLMLIYALSCWYAAFFVFLIFFVRLLLQLLLRIKKNIICHQKYHFRAILRHYYLQLPLQILLIWLFIYVYVLVSNDPTRSTKILLENSPQIKYLANGSNVDGTYLSGAYFNDLYSLFGLDFQQEVGIGIGLFAVFVGALIFLFGVNKKIYNSNFYLWIVAITLVYFYFHVWFDQFSIHKFFFELIPGFNSIRYPARYVIILGFALIYLIFYTLDKALTKTTGQKVVVLVVGLIVLMDQYRAPFKGWDQGILINAELMSQKEKIVENCDYFYYNFPGGWWYEQIEAMMFATQIGVPTVNGYSGAFPPNYPMQNLSSFSEPSKIFKWISNINPEKKGCFVTGRSELKKLNSNFDVVDFVGFTGQEINGKNSWRWSISPNPYVYIISNSFQRKKINFMIDTSDCYKVQKISITDGNNNSLISDLKIDEATNVEIEIDLTREASKRIQFTSDADPCKVSGDPRSLFFEIKNFSIQ